MHTRFLLLLVLLTLLVLPSAFAADTAQRIACVGDSITAGYGLTDQTESWPNTLKRLLGDEGRGERLGHR